MKPGQTIDSLGVDITMQDGDLVTDVVVVTKILEPDGSVRLSLGWSDGMSWIERLGMVTAAYQLEAVKERSE